jgi:uncharacterized Zn finger protein (UPF0148 family)
MSREVPFDPEAICDVCGKPGAFDFMGDCVCPDCIHEMIPVREESKEEQPE